MLLVSFLQKLVHLDQTVLFYINQILHNGLFDFLMPWLREPILWLPLYIFAVAFVIQNFGWKGLAWIGFFVLSITLADQISSTFIKKSVARLRPCNDPFMMQYIKLRIQSCGSGLSFTSSHAANHFAMAAFAVKTLQNIVGKHIRWAYLWAFSICYAQMYVGVHYPLDITGGAIVGIACGMLCAYIFNQKIGFQAFTQKDTLTSSAKRL